MRTILLWMARNNWLRTRLPRMRFVRRAVRTFMPGEDLGSAVSAAIVASAQGITAVFTLVGENLASLDEARTVVDHYHQLLDEIEARRIEAAISVKLTQLGLDLDPQVAAANFDELAAHAARVGTWAWIDIEGSALAEATVAFFERARAAHENVGLCLQSYLRRTPDDVQRLLPLKPAIRLVKGAYDEPVFVAYRSRREVDAAYVAIATSLLPAVRDGQARLIVATHDLDLIEQIARIGNALGLANDRVEITMLYGIRSRDQRRLAERGFAVSCLISYGEHWYAWYMRRLAERPANLAFALRQLLPW